MSVALFFMHRQFGGGATSFTVHLYRGMQRAGLAPVILRLAPRTESRERPFSRYEGVTYRNVNIDEAVRTVSTTPSLMTAAVHSKELPFAPDAIPRLMQAGMRVVTHDPNEYKVYDYIPHMTQPPFCIRPTMKKFFPKSVFIPHPYVREFEETRYERGERELLAVSVARVSFVKRSLMILEANELLSKRDRIVLRGAENRLYTRHKILPRFPNFEQGGTGFPMTWGASARECRRGKFAVDMTYFPDDGGGTQYSLMEAWDAGTVNIVHEDWLRYAGEMQAGVNCLQVADHRELAKVVATGRNRDVADVVDAGYHALSEHHDPVRVARRYYRELTK